VKIEAAMQAAELEPRVAKVTARLDVSQHSPPSERTRDDPHALGLIKLKRAKKNPPSVGRGGFSCIQFDVLHASAQDTTDSAAFNTRIF